MTKRLIKILSILNSVLLPFLIKAQEAKPYQIAENNVIIRFAEKREESAAREIAMIAANARLQLTEKYQLAMAAPVEIRLSATTYEFCQVTGRPWWQASIYRGHVIYLQPIRVLRERGILETTLRHELVHQLIDEHGKGNSPAWFSEALAIYHSGEIVFLKPLQKKIDPEELKWFRLEKRLKATTNKAQAERLYFQLYHLGHFLENNFTAEQRRILLAELAQKTSFELACDRAFGVNAIELEQRWLSHWTKR